VTIIFDLDGTLADISHRRHLVSGHRSEWSEFFRQCVNDRPKLEVIKVFRLLQKSGAHLEIWSGRSAEVRHGTRKWLTDNVFDGSWMWDEPEHPYYVRLLMRPVNDYVPDDVLKERWLNEALNEGLTIDMAFDDRQKVVDMWRRRNITCAQVAPGDF
jgi:phosphoglycolate phosphatase-like HAD superfamily hydrolase